MACQTTECNDCGHYATNVYLDKCPECGSKNVDAEYDPDEKDAQYFEDSVSFDEDDTRCGGER